MVQGLPFNFLAIVFLCEAKVSHVLQTSYYSYMLRDVALPSLNASVSIFFMGLSVSILKTFIKNVKQYDIFVV